MMLASPLIQNGTYDVAGIVCSTQIGLGGHMGIWMFLT